MICRWTYSVIGGTVSGEVHQRHGFLSKGRGLKIDGDDQNHLPNSSIH
jgi:hypothetical protein